MQRVAVLMSVAGANQGTPMDQVSVYRFEVWDHEIGDNVWSPRMATLEAIKRVGGQADLQTETLVDSADLDGNGFYPKKTSSS